MSQYTEVRPQLNDGWSFAYVNGRLAEIYFSPEGVLGHCYVNVDEYSKKEQEMIEQDVKKYRFTYRDKTYFDQLRKLKFVFSKHV